MKIIQIARKITILRLKKRDIIQNGFSDIANSRKWSLKLSFRSANYNQYSKANLDIWILNNEMKWDPHHSSRYIHITDLRFIRLLSRTKRAPPGFKRHSNNKCLNRYDIPRYIANLFSYRKISERDVLSLRSSPESDLEKKWRSCWANYINPTHSETQNVLSEETNVTLHFDQYDTDQTIAHFLIEIALFDMWSSEALFRENPLVIGRFQCFWWNWSEKWLTFECKQIDESCCWILEIMCGNQTYRFQWGHDRVSRTYRSYFEFNIQETNGQISVKCPW
jgi:hypothetical protein